MAEIYQGEPFSNGFEGNDLLSIDQFGDRSELQTVFDLAFSMRSLARERKLPRILSGYSVFNMAGEASTRTLFSTDIAMRNLGADVTTVQDMSKMSMGGEEEGGKGESLQDTVKTLSQLYDIIFMRHKEVGAVSVAAEAASIPVVNSGDGSGEHPTQALLDLFTIKDTMGAIDGLEVTVLGDNLYSRANHSLVKGLALYERVIVNYVSPQELMPPQSLVDSLTTRGLQQRFFTDVRDVLPTTDFLMGSRVQAVRYKNKAVYERFKDSYKITTEMLDALLKDGGLIGHAMPVKSEYTEAVKDDPRNVMYQQVNNGKHIRQAIAALLLGKSLPSLESKPYSLLTEL